MFIDIITRSKTKYATLLYDGVKTLFTVADLTSTVQNYSVFIIYLFDLSYHLINKQQIISFLV